MIEKIEAKIMDQREEARYLQVTGEAYEKIDEKNFNDILNVNYKLTEINYSIK